MPEDKTGKQKQMKPGTSVKKSLSPSISTKGKPSKISRGLKTPEICINHNLINRSFVHPLALASKDQSKPKSLQKSKSKKNVATRDSPANKERDPRTKQSASIGKSKRLDSKSKKTDQDFLFGKRLSVCSQVHDNEKRSSALQRQQEPSHEKFFARKTPDHHSLTKKIAGGIHSIRPDLSNTSKCENIAKCIERMKGMGKSRDSKSIKRTIGAFEGVDLNFRLSEKIDKPKRKQTFLNQKSSKDESKIKKPCLDQIAKNTLSPNVKRKCSKKRLQASERSTLIHLPGESDSSDIIVHRPIKKSASQTRSRSKLQIDPHDLAKQTQKAKKKLSTTAKNKNSLKDLLEQYSQLKSGVDTEKIDPEKLNKLKSKLNSIQNLIDRKLRQINRREPGGVYERAAIVIQKYARGYLVRKFISKYLVKTNPTFESFEAMENVPRTDSINSLSQTPEPGDVTIDNDLHSSEHRIDNYKCRFIKPKVDYMSSFKGHSRPHQEQRLAQNTSSFETGLIGQNQMTTKQSQKPQSKMKIKKPTETETYSKIPTLVQRHHIIQSGARKEKKMTPKNTDHFDTQPKNEIFACNTFENLSERNGDSLAIKGLSGKVKTLPVDESLRKKLKAENESGEITVKNSKKSSGDLIKVNFPEPNLNYNAPTKPQLRSAITVVTSPINAFQGFVSDQKSGKITSVESIKNLTRAAVVDSNDKAEAIIEQFFNAEYKNWAALETVLQELNALVCNRKQSDDKFQVVVQKINEITAQNLMTLKNVISKNSRDVSFKKKQESKLVANPSCDEMGNFIKQIAEGQRSGFKLGQAPFSFSSPRTPLFAQKQSGSLLDDSGKVKSNKIIKKSEMDIWPNSSGQHHLPSLSLPLNGINSLLIDRHRDSDDKFFYTEREQPKDSKILSQCHETLSRDVSKTSFEVRQQLMALQTGGQILSSQKSMHLVLQNIEHFNFKAKNNLAMEPFEQVNEDQSTLENMKVVRQGGAATNGLPFHQLYPQEYLTTNNLEESFNGFDTQIQQLKPCNSDLEYIEVPIECTFGDATNKSICVELIIEFLLYDILDEEIWRQILLPLSTTSKEAIDEDTIYGIRTNINAVNEYCNLLIKFIEETQEEKVTGLINAAKKGNLPKRGPIEIEQIRGVSVWKLLAEDGLILDADVYLTLESQILDNYKGMNIVDELFEMQRIYHRCVFDCFNEILTSLVNRSRRYAMSVEETKLLTAPQFIRSSVKIVLEKTKTLLLEKTMNLCGLIRDKEDSMMGKSVKNFDLDTVQLIREERLSKMLTADFVEERVFCVSKITADSLAESAKQEIARMIEDELFTELAFCIDN